MTPKEVLRRKRIRVKCNQWKTGRGGTCVPLVLPEGYDSYRVFYEEVYMAATQCDGCAKPFPPDDGSGLALGREMEHDGRDTGVFRGIVCKSCNQRARYDIDGDSRLSAEEKHEHAKAAQRKHYAANKEQKVQYRRDNQAHINQMAKARRAAVRGQP